MRVLLDTHILIQLFIERHGALGILEEREPTHTLPLDNQLRGEILKERGLFTKLGRRNIYAGILEQNVFV